jgi:hypothetical protein
MTVALLDVQIDPASTTCAPPRIATAKQRSPNF